jgi:hypothetical protein
MPTCLSLSYTLELIHSSIFGTINGSWSDTYYTTSPTTTYAPHTETMSNFGKARPHRFMTGSKYYKITQISSYATRSYA